MKRPVNISLPFDAMKALPLLKAIRKVYPCRIMVVLPSGEPSLKIKVFGRSYYVEFDTTRKMSAKKWPVE